MNNTNELQKNKFRIISNPYSREIVYDYWDFQNEDWVSPSDTSDFKRDKFTKAAIYHKAYDIIETALQSYGGNVGLDIYFEGTEDDFNYLNEIVDRYFHDKEINIIESDHYLPVVNEIKRDIGSKFKEVEDMFKKYPCNSATEKIKNFTDTMSDTIPICVMGLYSTGKSAFINSLLGVEILPSADDPTTAKTFKISVGANISDYTISFEYQDKLTSKTNIKLEFRGGKFKINRPKTSGIISELNAVKTYKSEYDRMYHALSIINAYDKDYKPDESSEIKWRVSPLIKVTLPLKSSYTSLPIDHYNFVIYDTPGSNSASNSDHNKVLKDAMKEQTNGLPIYLITSKNMDSDSNTELMATLNELGDSLDRNNLMIIVNQADDPSVKELVSKKTNYDSLAVHRLNPAGTYFVSSVMGLGSELLTTQRSTRTEDEDADTGELKTIEVPDFIDSHYLELFKKNKKDFVSMREPKALYLYNIVPRHEFDKYKDSVDLKEPNKRIFYNSGLDAVGSAITDFAENYSLYNKCRNAGNYLTEAFDLLTNEIERKKQEQEEFSKRLDEQLDDTTKALIKKLKDTIRAKQSEYQRSFVDAIQQDYECNRKLLNKEKITAYSNSTLKGSHGLRKKREFTSKMKELLEKELSNQWTSLRRLANNHWEMQKSDLKESLIQIIIETPSLTPEQKNILQIKIKDINVSAVFKWNVYIEPKEIISGFIWLKIKEEITATCLNIFDAKTASAVSSISLQWNKAFDQMQSSLINKSISALATHNPEVLKIKKEIDNCQKDIENMDKQKNYVSDKIVEIRELTEFKDRSEKEV